MKPSRLFVTLGAGFLLSATLFGCQATTPTAEKNAQTTPAGTDSMASTIKTDAENKANTDKPTDTAVKTDSAAKTDTTTKTPAPAPKQPVVQGIAITSTGFSPANITIAPGTKVIFSNLDEAKHWPASDSHPSHKLCPGFDSLKALGKNQTYEFTFAKAQVCPFHDHLNPSWTGTITVK